MTSIYSLAVLTSAFLLFLVQPMAAKVLLPHLGGSPAVWNTAMVFFQTLLLLGYCYAHATARLGVRRQVTLHVALVAASLLLLPLAIQTELGFSSVEQPVRWVMTALVLSVGVPFFLLSANAPMLQYWFAHTGHRDAHNPYFLYAASNIGSMAALLGYPFLLEPHWGLVLQFHYWSLLYAAFVLLLALCGGLLWKKPELAVAQAADEADEAPGWQRRMQWVLLAFVPSSLLLGVTAYITTDIASMPLFWVIPLAIYLLTFIFAFAKRPIMVERAQEAQISLVTITALLIAFEITFLTQLVILHLFAFFAVAMGCHGQLVKLRPSARRLTEFYLWISLGGMLGGMFSSLLAPIIFKLPLEYPLVLALAMFLRPGAWSKARLRTEGLLGTGFFALVVILLLGIGALYRAHAPWVGAIDSWLAATLPTGMMDKPVSLMQLLAVAFFLLSMGMAWLTRERPLGFAIGIAAILLAAPLTGSGFSSAFFKQTIYTERNFFGVNRVIHIPQRQVHYLVHGTTLHGTQSLEPAHRLDLVSYYPPLRDAYNHLRPGGLAGKPIAVVGLGGGTLACLADSGQEADLFEIDPAVVAIAQNPQFFTYLRDCPGKYRTILGDGRLTLANQPDGRYGLIVLDAFSSDAVPLHLMTREAVKLYMSKLAPGGVLVFNISNNHLDLAPVVAAIADANGLVAVTKREFNPKGPLAVPAIWALVARKQEDFHNIGEAIPGWHVLLPKAGIEPWTDDYSNIFQVLM